MEFKAVREEIEADEPNYELIVAQLKAICDKYARLKWDFAENYEELKEELEELDVDEMDDDSLNWYLDEFYDLCDSARVWLEI